MTDSIMTPEKVAEYRRMLNSPFCLSNAGIGHEILNALIASQARESALREALERAVILMQATHDLIKKCDDSRIVLNAPYVTVFYDEADCDGYCLMEDCEAAIDDARTALTPQDHKESR